MPRKPRSKKTLSMKNRLSIIALMFVVINLIFYFMFGTSDESGESVEMDGDDEGKNQLNVENEANLKQEVTNPISP